MESYSALAASYDELTQDVGYEKRAAFVEKLFLRSHIPVHTVLDLACGTGTMTALLTERGYELIGVDGSEDMLLEAREKAQTLTGVPPLFLHQSMPELDLYGTVEAAICCLDSLNYLTEAREVRETFRRLHLFIARRLARVRRSCPRQARGDGRSGLARRTRGCLLRVAHGVFPPLAPAGLLR